MTNIDTCFLEAKPVKLPSWSKVEFLLVGCGGTGSALASAVARLMRLLAENGKQARATFIDPDYVEPKNISRQQFCDAEIDKPKALVLAARCSMAWGVEITGVVKPFDPAMAQSPDYSEIKIILGCIDNGAARQAIAESLTRANSFRQVPRTWWLDGFITKVIKSLFQKKNSDYNKPIITKECNYPFCRLLLIKNETEQSVATWRAILKYAPYDLLLNLSSG
jgi:molybdopterin/thiamine biosynthesis adenylyltransferase